MTCRHRGSSPTFLFLVLLGALTSLLVACGQAVREEWRPGVPKLDGTVDEGRQEGLWTYYFAAGGKQAQGAWEHDFQTGRWAWWYPDGQLRQEGEYDGRGLDPAHFSSAPRTGVWLHFHANGQLAATGRYAADRQVGTWLYFTAAGRPFASGTYAAGLRDGAWTWYGADGAPALHGSYAAGIRTGAWTAVGAGSSAADAPAPTRGPALAAVGLTAPPRPTVPSAPADATVADATTPEASPIATAPVLWTLRQQRDADALVRRYAGISGPGLVDDHAVAGPGGDRQRHDLLGKPLPQTRFIDARGEIIDTNDEVGKRMVALIILRGFSGGVGVDCAAQAAALAGARMRCDQAGVAVILVYPGVVESVPVFLAALQGLLGQPPRLAVALDVNLQLVHALGIEDNLAKPTAILLDRQGIVRYAYVGRSIADRPGVGDLLWAALHLQQ